MGCGVMMNDDMELALANITGVHYGCANGTNSKLVLIKLLLVLFYAENKDFLKPFSHVLRITNLRPSFIVSQYDFGQ
jgi:hypothetical protein